MKTVLKYSENIKTSYPNRLLLNLTIYQIIAPTTHRKI